MPDREKVIKALECFSKNRICLPHLIPWNEIVEAISLLKEQEMVEPINSYGTFRCRNCRNIVGYNDGYGRGYQNNFCSKCGQAVKWE